MAPNRFTELLLAALVATGLVAVGGTAATATPALPRLTTSASPRLDGAPGVEPAVRRPDLSITQVSVNAAGAGTSAAANVSTTMSRNGKLAVYREGGWRSHLYAVDLTSLRTVTVNSSSTGVLAAGVGPEFWQVTDDGSRVMFVEQNSEALLPQGWSSQSTIYVKDLTTGRLDGIRLPVIDRPASEGPGRERLRMQQPLEMSGDGRRVAVGTQTRDTVGAMVYDAATRTWTDLCTAVGPGCYLRALSPNGRWAVVVDAVGTPSLLDIDAGTTRILPGSPPPGTYQYVSCLFPPDSASVICSRDDGPPFEPAYTSTQWRLSDLHALRSVAFTAYGGVADVDAHGQRWIIEVSRGGKPPSFYDPYDAYILEPDTGRTILLNATPDGHRGNGLSSPVAITPDGRQALFSSHSTNLTPNDRTPAWSLFTAQLPPTRP